MRRLLFLTSIYCTLSMSFCQAIDEKSHLLGTWLSMPFTEALETSKSPRNTINKEGGKFVFFNLTNNKSELEWSASADLHDGVASKAIMKFLPNEKKYELRIPEQSPERHYLKFIGTSYDSLIYWEGKESMQMVRVGSATEDYEKAISSYINQHILAGTYEDAKGRLFRFTEDQEAIWPDEQFRYEIGIDFFLASTDYFSIADKKDKHGQITGYAYEWKGSKLFIYKFQIDQEELEKVGEPLYILSPKEQ